jgi:hypothetical protein
MNKNTIISLPHPVLGNGNDITGSFAIDIKAELNGEDLILSQIGDIQFTNEYFQQLSQDKKIIPAFKILSQGTLYAEVHTDFLQKTIKCHQLSWKIDIEIFLIANEEITDFCDNTFNEDFMIGNPNRNFQIEKGMIVGFGGNKQIFFDSVYVNSLSGIIDFYPIPINERVSFDLNGPKIIIKYPKEEGSYDMVTMLGQKTSKFKYTFLNIFILPALSAAYDALKNAQDEDIYLTFLENHNWATIMDSHEPDWDSSKGSYELAQWFFQQMVSKNKSQMKDNTIEVPVVASFKELENYIN